MASSLFSTRGSTHCSRVEMKEPLFNARPPSPICSTPSDAPCSHTRLKVGHVIPGKPTTQTLSAFGHLAHILPHQLPFQPQILPLQTLSLLRTSLVIPVIVSYTPSPVPGTTCLPDKVKAHGPGSTQLTSLLPSETLFSLVTPYTGLLLPINLQPSFSVYTLLHVPEFSLGRYTGQVRSPLPVNPSLPLAFFWFTFC